VVTLRQLLDDMIQKRASDLHLTAGVPPMFRTDGLLVPAEYDVLAPEGTAALAYSVMSDEQRKRFETTKELDFSFGVKNLARFRANVFLQRGVVSMAIRMIPYEILQLEKLGLPPVVGENQLRRCSTWKPCSVNVPSRPPRAHRATATQAARSSSSSRR